MNKLFKMLFTLVLGILFFIPTFTANSPVNAKTRNPTYAICGWWLIKTANYETAERKMEFCRRTGGRLRYVQKNLTPELYQAVKKITKPYGARGPINQFHVNYMYTVNVDELDRIWEKYKKPVEDTQIAKAKKESKKKEKKVAKKEGCIEGNCINGQGTQLWPNGSKYVGEWKEGKVDGQGTWTHPNGDKYSGEWKNGLKHGQGTFVCSCGSKYVGEFKNGKYHGQGTHIWAEGNKYVGEWKEGKAHGQGIYTWVNGDVYVGEWKDRKSDGQGTLTKADGTIEKGIWKKGNLVKRDKKQTQIAKKEKKKTKKVAKQATTTLKPIKKITQLKKQPKKKEKKVAKKEKKTIVSEVAKREPSKCDDKKLNKKKCKEFEAMERKVTVETVMALGTFEAFNDYPEGMLEEFGNCKKQFCRAKKAGEKVYEYFVRRGKLWHARHPGDMIYGMAWFEIVYLEKLRKNKKEIARFINDDYGSSTLTRKKKKDIKALHSLIKMNEGKIKMRKALGLSADDSLATVLGSHFLLGNFLNNNTFKVSKVSLNSGVKKRKDLLEKYQAAIKKYKAKLKEGKEG